MLACFESLARNTSAGQFLANCLMNPSLWQCVVIDPYCEASQCAGSQEKYSPKYSHM